MPGKTLSIVVLIAISLAGNGGFVMAQSPEEMGRALFSNPNFAGGQGACNDCHPNGRRLEKAGTKTTFHLMDKTQNSLEEAINVCITQALNGKAIPVDSQEMKALASYIRSVGAKAGSGSGR